MPPKGTKRKTDSDDDDVSNSRRPKNRKVDDVDGKKDDDDLYISPDKFLMADENFVDYIKQNFKVNFLDVNPEVDKVQEGLLQKLLARAKNRKQYYCF